MIDIHFNIDIDTTRISDNVERRMRKAQFDLDTQILKDSNFYIPVRKHYLERSGNQYSLLGRGYITWVTPYARRLYYNPEYKFSKNINPNARGLWFEAAKAEHEEDWVRLANESYKKG